MINKNHYFILSASCKLVKGLKRSVIIDYGRGDLYFISGDYLDLIEFMDRKRVGDVEMEIDEDSKGFFQEFMSFIEGTEIGFFTDDPDRFPIISEDTMDDYVLLGDVIIEVDEKYFDRTQFKNLCRELGELRCKDFEIRLLSEFDLVFIDEILEIIDTADANCVEIHGTYNASIDTGLLHKFIEKKPLISKIFLYSAPVNKVTEVINYTPNLPVSLGDVYFLSYDFDNGNCCGVINQENLNYTSFYVHNQLKKRNGCLDRKMSIDRYGNIRNCPSMRNQYGNIRDVSIKDIIRDNSFTKYWFITKDQVSTCKVCEFRYNCTDCRAFLQDPDDMFSKPLKCGYDPATCKWEDWSLNPLKKMEESKQIFY